MPRRTAYALYKEINNKFTTFSLSVATFIEARSLLNVPEKQWKLFSVLVYVHIVLSICLCVSGIVCFCLGMVHSVLYNEVSCSNGVDLFMPFLNVVSSFAGLIAVRALHMSWPPLIHVVTLFLAIWSLTVITVVSCADANELKYMASVTHIWLLQLVLTSVWHTGTYTKCSCCIELGGGLRRTCCLREVLVSKT
ncbi:hypothetical protein RB195_021100 [Necator americanus]|uniref:Uncharacterized protein n=1 Tax=Necator americanus TaxID=51031 RepID=A0ABR1E9D6_NECAM